MEVTGNPSLRLMRPIGAVIRWLSTHRWGTAAIQASYQNVAHQVYSTYTLDPTRDIYVKSYRNGGDYDHLTTSASLQFNIIPDRLRLQTEAFFHYDHLHAWSTLTRGAFQGRTSLIYLAGPVNARIDYSSPFTTLLSTGETMRTGTMLDLAVGYTLRGWSFGIQARNPFYKVSRVLKLDAPGITQTQKIYSPGEAYHYCSMRITYRFDYGRKHKFEKVDVDTSPSSAILTH